MVWSTTTAASHNTPSSRDKSNSLLAMRVARFSWVATRYAVPLTRISVVEYDTSRCMRLPISAVSTWTTVRLSWSAAKVRNLGAT